MQRFINIDTFFCLLSRRPRQTLLFTTRKVNKLELGHGHIVRVFQILTLYRQTEDAVGA